jgi:hypothetical protein
MTRRASVPALDPIVGIRVVATPAAIDGAAWTPTSGTRLWRTAPDEVLAWAADAVVEVTVDDPDAIVEPEHGFVSATLSGADVELVSHHVDVPLPTELPGLVQGKIAGVPASLALVPGGGGILVVQAAYADELARRLGW